MTIEGFDLEKASGAGYNGVITVGAIAGAGTWVLGCRLGLEFSRRAGSPSVPEGSGADGAAAMGEGAAGSDGPDVAPT
ncbi:MAG: hypothetical protein M0013_10095 [Actinomycetota bacterium]|nr:hypothetical protein [Actinomycetota bacterium]